MKISDQTCTIAQLKDQIRHFVEERDWEQFHTPKDLAIGLSVEAAELLEQIRSEFIGLPFAERWLHAFSDEPRKPLQRLLRSGAVGCYPVLDDLGHGMVAQAEHTLLLTSGGVEVLTA